MVINADDFGYFECVSRGIINCIQKGAISATAVMANGPRFKELAKWLHDAAEIDLGVHLNITYGLPITKQLQRKLTPAGGHFADKIATVFMLIQKKLTLEDVLTEWRAQIERSLGAGLKIRFLNSHEHIHIFPSLAGLIPALAEEYGINDIRWPLPEWKNQAIGLKALLRNTLMGICIWSSGYHLRKNHGPRVLGIGVSGKLTLKYLNRCFHSLTPGKAYELMCHPGIYDQREISDRRLSGYHAWDKEMELLTSDSIKELMRRCNIQMKRFSELDQG
jgi:predicted glycoside hydrolase/deacetylase ChbG (UPF0249 family)